jgi:hypothetical protein
MSAAAFRSRLPSASSSSSQDGDDDTDSHDGGRGAVLQVPQRVRHRLDLEHVSRVKALERKMLPLMSKGPQHQRDEAKAAFDSSLHSLTLQHARKLREAVIVASTTSLYSIDSLQCVSDEEPSAPRSVRVASAKRVASSKKRAGYFSRRIYREMRALHAARSSDFSTAAKMISVLSADLEYHVEDGQTLLLAAASMDMHEVIAHLLRAGARVDSRDKLQRDAAVVAASRNCSASVDAVLDHMNVAMLTCDSVESCMQHAISFSNPAIARSLLRHVHITNRPDFKRILDWSLIAAAAAADASTLQLFLERGACANAVDSLRRSALMHAVSCKVAARAS